MKTEKTPNTVLILLFISVAAVVIISMKSLYIVYISYENNSFNQASPQLLFGISGIIISLYITITQFGRRRKMPTVKSFDMITMMECSNCGFKSTRGFVKGDYVFKSMDKCPKCSGDMLVASIYHQEEKKS